MTQSKFLDAHTHIQFRPYDDDREAVISRARDANVKMILVGTQLATSKAGVLLAEQYPDDMWAAVAVHPSHASDNGWHHDENEQSEARREAFDIEALRSLAMHEKVIAIGECGLDYFRLPDDAKELAETKAKQKEIFMAQIELSQELKKPLMLHLRSGTNHNAFQEAIEILKSPTYKVMTGIVHFFTGTPEDAKDFLDLGFSFTFGGVVTFTRSYDETIKSIPLDHILSETDAPYVSPAPYRGKRNEPAYVIETVKKLAEIKGISVDQMADQIKSNARRIFSISI